MLKLFFNNLMDENSLETLRLVLTFCLQKHEQFLYVWTLFLYAFKVLANVYFLLETYFKKYKVK